jgi:Protein of unknown function (DUF1579)
MQFVVIMFKKKQKRAMHFSQSNLRNRIKNKKPLVKYCLIVGLICLLSVYSARGQDSIYNKLSKIGVNHKLLAGLIGSWTYEGKHFFSDSLSTSFVFHGSAVKKSILNGRFFTTEWKSQKKFPMAWSDGKLFYFQNLTIEGFDNIKKKFVYADVSNEFETGIFTMKGDYDSLSKTITYTGKSSGHLHEGGEQGEEITFKELVRFVDRNHFDIDHYEYENEKQIVYTQLRFSRKNR